MEERDQVFRERLLAVMTALNGGEFRDPVIRRVVGGFAYRMARQAGARNWSDLKARIDKPTYDALLKTFQEQGAAFQQAGDMKSVRGVEALALSLIARNQSQADLIPGVGFLDRFIESCAALVKPTSRGVASTPRTRH